MTYVRNKEIGLFLDTKDFKTLELEHGTHNGQPVYRVAFKFLYMHGVAVFTVAIFSEKEDAQECYDLIMEHISEEYVSIIPGASILDVQNKVKESLLIMPDSNNTTNIALEKQC